MLTPTTKAAIARDFALKRDTYFQTNYATETPQNFVRRLRRRLILQEVGERAPQSRVLDAGCGPAILYPEVLEQCAAYVALDLSPANLEAVAAANANPKVACIQGDLDTFPWPPEEFDVIICGGAIEYTSDPERILLKMMESLRVGGLLVCSFPNAWSPYRVWSEFAYTPLSQCRKRLLGQSVNNYPRRLFFPAAIRRLLLKQAAAFKSRGFGQKLLLQPLDALSPGLDQWINAACERHSARWLQGIASEFLVVARK